MSVNLCKQLALTVKARLRYRCWEGKSTVSKHSYLKLK